MYCFAEQFGMDLGVVSAVNFGEKLVWLSLFKNRLALDCIFVIKSQKFSFKSPDLAVPFAGMIFCIFFHNLLFTELWVIGDLDEHIKVCACCNFHSRLFLKEENLP